MSTNPVHIRVPVDIMHVMAGPSAETMLALPEWKDGNSKENKVRLTLRTDASPHQFTRSVFITSVREERESILDAMESGDLKAYFDAWDSKRTGNLVIRGFVGRSWGFRGVYNPQTRKGTLRVVAPLTHEQEQEIDRLDGLDQVAIRSRGGL